MYSGLGVLAHQLLTMRALAACLMLPLVAIYQSAACDDTRIAPDYTSCGAVLQAPCHAVLQALCHAVQHGLCPQGVVDSGDRWGKTKWVQDFTTKPTFKKRSQGSPTLVPPGIEQTPT